MKDRQRNKFRQIRRIVGISALVLAIAISIVPVRSYAEPGGETAVLTEVTDRRSSVQNLERQTSATATGLSASTGLTITDSEGIEVFARMDAVTAEAGYNTEAFYDSDTKSAFELSFSEPDVTYQSMTMLLTLPESFRKDGYITVLGVSGDGLGVVYQGEVTAETDHVPLYISGTNYPDGKFALLCNTAPVTIVRDERTDTTKASKTTAAISNELLTDRVFTVSTGGNTIKALLDANGSYAYDDLSVFTTSLTDPKGTPLRKDGSASDYGAISVQMALPDAMKTATGRVKLFSVGEDGSLDTELGESIYETEDTSFLTFRTEHTGEYAIAYFSNADTGGAVTVRDNRKDCSQTAKTTASLPPSYTSKLFLTIDASEGAVITPLIEANGTYRYTDLSAFTMTMTDAESGGNPVSDFGICTITMVLPDDMDTAHGRVYLLGVNADGTLNAGTGAVLNTAAGTSYLTFEAAVMTEYAILYDAADQYPVTVTGSREDALTITASVTNGGSSAWVLEINQIEDPENTAFYLLIQDTEQLNGYSKALFYDIALRDTAGNAVDDFGTCTITLELPEEMDPDTGSFRIVTTQENNGNVLDRSIDPVIRKENGKSYLVFTTTHFTPYAALYTASADTGSETSAGQTGSSTASPVIVTPGNTLPSPGTTSNTAASGSSAATGASASSSGSGGGSSTSTASSGTADMPKTADMTTYRNVFVMILLVFGALMLVSSFRFEKQVRRRKKR